MAGLWKRYSSRMRGRRRLLCMRAAWIIPGEDLAVLLLLARGGIVGLVAAGAWLAQIDFNTVWRFPGATGH